MSDLAWYDYVMIYWNKRMVYKLLQMKNKLNTKVGYEMIVNHNQKIKVGQVKRECSGLVGDDHKSIFFSFK